MLKNWIHNLISKISRRRIEKWIKQSPAYNEYKVEFNEETGEITLNGGKPQLIYPVDFWIPQKSEVD